MEAQWTDCIWCLGGQCCDAVRCLALQGRLDAMLDVGESGEARADEDVGCSAGETSFQ